MKYTFSKTSLGRLSGDGVRPPVYPPLVRALKRALGYGIMDFSILCGGRLDEEQKGLYAKGRTEEGPIVTWTLNSKHLKQKDGFSHAVDIAPYPLDWNDLNKFWMLRGIIMAACKEEGVKARYLESGKDLPHIEVYE